MVEYDVRPVTNEYIAGQEVQIRVRVANRGATAIEIPDPEMRASTQPTHHLTGPRWPEGVTFTNCRVLREGDELAEGANARLITIEPGKEWSGMFAANSFVSLAREGEYTLASELNFRDVKVQSKETTFRVRALQTASIHLGLGIRPMETGEGEGAFIDSGAVFAFTFKELRPAIGEAKVDRPIRRAAVGPNATDASAPSRNAPFFNETLRWLVWREGREVKGVSSSMREPVSVALPSELSRLVRPALKVTGRPVDVLALSKDERTLHLAHVGADRGQPAFANVVWSAQLPAAPGSITAALGPEAGGSERHVAFVAKRDGGKFEIFHSRYKEGGQLAPFQSSGPIEGSVLDGSTIGIFADASGAATVGAMAFGGSDGRATTFVEVKFGADGKAAAPTVTSLGSVAAAPVNATVLYADKAGSAQRAAVVQLEDGKLFKLVGTQLVPVSVLGAPTSPILIAPGKQTTYILYFDSGRGLYLESL